MNEGMLLILADVAEVDEAEFNRWYDREHMRERIAIPGFLAGHRYRNDGAGLRYLATYRTESLETFTSEAYRAALAAQSEWSRAVLPTFRSPQRCVATRTVRAGYGMGSAAGLWRLRTSEERRGRLRSATANLMSDLCQRDGIVAGSLLEADPRLSCPVAEYPKNGLRVLEPDDWLLAIEAQRSEDLPDEVMTAATADIVDEVTMLGTFILLWGLDRADLGEAPETTSERDG